VRLVRTLAALVWCSSLLNCALPARAAGAGSQLQALARDVTFTWSKEHPLQATALGLTQYDGDLDQPSQAEVERDLAQIRTWQTRLQRISLEGATLVERDDALLLKAQLTGMERQYTVYRTFEKDYAGPANAVFDTVFLQFEYLPIAGREGATHADVARAWDAIIARLGKAPAYILAGQALVTTPGHLYGIVGAESLEQTSGFLDGPLTQAAKAQVDAARFARLVQARNAIKATIAQTVHYIRANVASWPENYAMGRAAYDAMLHDEQLLPYSAADIETLGQLELAHGRTEQIWLIDLARRRGTPIGPATGGGLAPGGPALIAYYRLRLAQLKQWVIAHDIVVVPAWLGDVRVVETPAFLQPVSPGASSQSPRTFARETTGFYYITPPKSLVEAARTLDANEDFDRDRIWSTGAHETMPGHFLQLSIARRHPDFVRRIQDSAVFAEGWAFYGEEMFVRLGLYGDDLDARYYTAQWECVRGARATVDPKLASGEWSYDRAVDFFAAKTGFTRVAAKEAVAGIALGPGYEISYTVGRLQLENLLAEYWRRMGSRASLLDFHTRLLSYGTTPFAIVAPELLADLDKPLSAVRAAARY
jgi:uncharacterized protein (DUF885 family)